MLHVFIQITNFLKLIMLSFFLPGAQLEQIEIASERHHSVQPSEWLTTEEPLFVWVLKHSRNWIENKLLTR